LRIKIVLGVKQQGCILGFDYQDTISKMILNFIQEYSSSYGRQNNPLLSFGQLMIPERSISNEGIQILGENAYLYISSPNSKLLKGIADGLNERSTLNFNNVSFEIEQIVFLNDPVIEESAWFTTLSPVLVSVMKNINGKMRLWNIGPDDPLFERTLVSNLYRRYKRYYGRLPRDRKFIIERVLSPKQKRIRVNNYYYRAYLMGLQVQGSSELLNFAYQAGLGEKTHLGFGMLGLLKFRSQESAAE